MNRALEKLDWTHLQSFVAVADQGSLTAAAQVLGQSQPTVGRHIKAIESILGVELFVRDLRGQTLTETGLALIEPAREMAAAAARLEQLAAGQDVSLSGTVRLTASVVVSHFILPPIIADIRRREPSIDIEVFPSDESENLVFRQADIAIRMFRPSQLDIVTKHIADQSIALYASEGLLQEFGQPQSLDEMASMPFVGFDRSDMIIRAMRGLGLNVRRGFFGVRCDDQAAYWQLVCAGCGVGAMQRTVGDRDPRVTRLDFLPELPPLPMWLAAPDALRRSARLKRVWDLLAVSLSEAVYAGKVAR